MVQRQLVLAADGHAVLSQLVQQPPVLDDLVLALVRQQLLVVDGPLGVRPAEDLHARHARQRPPGVGALAVEEPRSAAVVRPRADQRQPPALLGQSGQLLVLLGQRLAVLLRGQAVLARLVLAQHFDQVRRAVVGLFPRQVDAHQQGAGVGLALVRAPLRDRLVVGYGGLFAHRAVLVVQSGVRLRGGAV